MKNKEPQVKKMMDALKLIEQMARHETPIKKQQFASDHHIEFRVFKALEYLGIIKEEVKEANEGTIFSWHYKKADNEQDSHLASRVISYISEIKKKWYEENKKKKEKKEKDEKNEKLKTIFDSRNPNILAGGFVDQLKKEIKEVPTSFSGLLNDTFSKPLTATSSESIHQQKFGRVSREEGYVKSPYLIHDFATDLTNQDFTMLGKLIVEIAQEKSDRLILRNQLQEIQDSLAKKETILETLENLQQQIVERLREKK